MDETEEQLSQKGEQIRLVLHHGAKLNLQWELLSYRYFYYLLGLVEAEQMAGGEDDAVEYCHCQITIFGIACSKPTDERNGYDVDYSDGHHGAYRTAGVELGSLINVLCHGSAESAVRQIDASISQHEDAVGYCHIDNLGGLAPFRMCPESENQYQSRDRSSEEQPRAESSPSGMSLVCQCTDDRVVDGVPESGNKHQCSNGTHTDSEHISIEYHEEVAHEHPTEVAAYIAHTIGELADEGNLSL